MATKSAEALMVAEAMDVSSAVAVMALRRVRNVMMALCESLTASAGADR